MFNAKQIWILALGLALIVLCILFTACDDDDDDSSPGDDDIGDDDDFNDDDYGDDDFRDDDDDDNADDDWIVLFEENFEQNDFDQFWSLVDEDEVVEVGYQYGHNSDRALYRDFETCDYQCGFEFYTKQLFNLEDYEDVRISYWIYVDWSTSDWDTACDRLGISLRFAENYDPNSGNQEIELERTECQPTNQWMHYTVDLRDLYDFEYGDFEGLTDENLLFLIGYTRYYWLEDHPTLVFDDITIKVKEAKK